MTIRICKVCRFLSQINNAKENTERVRGEKKKVGKTVHQQTNKNSQKLGTQLSKTIEMSYVFRFKRKALFIIDA